MVRVRDPRLYALFDLLAGHGAVPPTVPQAPQPVAETAHVLLREAPAAARQQNEPQEGGRLADGSDVRLERVQAQAAAFEKPLDALPPFEKLRRIVVEEREVVNVAEVALGSQHLLAEVVEAVEIDLGEELAGEPGK